MPKWKKGRRFPLYDVDFWGEENRLLYRTDCSQITHRSFQLQVQ